MKTVIKTFAFLSYLLGALAVLNFVNGMVQFFIFDMISIKIYIAKIGISFLTLIICFKTLLEIDKKLY